MHEAETPQQFESYNYRHFLYDDECACVPPEWFHGYVYYKPNANIPTRNAKPEIH